MNLLRLATRARSVPDAGRSLALLAAYTLLVLGRFLFAPAGTALDVPDITRYYAWVHQFVSDSLRAGRLPLWNPFNYAGTPFAANPSVSLFYPPAWLCVLLQPVDAERWLIGGHALLSAAFMRLYLRRIGVGELPALAGALPWAFGGFALANASVGHLHVLFASAWLPLAVHFYERGWREPRRTPWLWAGVVLGVQLLAGEPQTVLYSALLLAAYGLVRGLAHRDAEGFRRGLAHRDAEGFRRGLAAWGLGLGAIGLVAALFAAVQLLPTLELLRLSDRGHSTYAFATALSLPPRSLIGLVLPWSPTVPWLTEGADNRLALLLNWEFAAYVGGLVLVLAALTARRAGPAARGLQGALVLGLALSLGSHTPLYRALYGVVPGLAAFRIPARALVIVVFCLSALAACGLERLAREDEVLRRRGWRTVGAGSLASLGALALLAPRAGALRLTEMSLYGVVSAVRPLTALDPFVLHPALGLFGAALLLVVVGRLPRRAAVVALAGFLAVDLLLARPEPPLARFSPDTDPSFLTLRALAAQAGATPCRVDLAPSHVAAAAALGARVENVNGYWPVSIGRFFRYAYGMRGLETPAVLRHQLHDQLYTAGDPFALRLLNVAIASRVAADGTSVLLRDPEPLPRAWIVESAERVSGEAEALARVRSPDFQPARTVILEAEPRLALAGSGADPGRATARALPGGGLDIDTDSPRGGYLVLSEVFYPGWRASVDGRPVALEPADDVLTALPLPPGRHRVRYVYEPASVRVGAGLTLATLVVALAFSGAGRRRAPPGPS
ncbi:MAG TPA: hypothetical protein VMT70_07255 [Vicinamibacteria bacterium]|nr:hypothetical protein [Vicinamibacteria bacterium]